ncbi:aminotransferase class V-fold PLP-dependent enzyme [Niabella pedocola]|uniref:Aminotransferase class V-fold PLP-dependent enzyme n=1 Tax=Niabella pedocola TaxID=1752077 RepID=A0ABS8PT49_9BACT|nr:aminotransferase class V-fold PLP-dependent enzyme [Niabella pedocola]MCD2424261.1 aminotransferase class V-fold PLP-dependent enzyme [Niabella pedocola]
MTEHITPVYLNTAACGLIANTVLQTGLHLYQGFEHIASAASEHWRDVQAPEIRSHIARFIATRPENIALIPNFSYGLNAVVQALSGQETVLLYRKDFPSVFIPFVINHFKVVWLDDDDGFSIDLNKIESLIRSEKIDVVAISHVQWHSGFRIDLQALCSRCRELGARTIVDATQSLGAVQISIPELRPDVLIASNYKWMNAGFGTGILYMSPEFAAQYPPRISGAHSNAFQFADLSFRQNTSVTNYEPGSPNMFGFSILNKAIEEKNSRGMEQIEAHNRMLTDALLQQLSVPVIGGRDLQNRSSIVVIREENGLHEFLLKNNIITTLRNGHIRVSIHFHNTAADIERLMQCIGDHHNG